MTPSTHGTVRRAVPAVRRREIGGAFPVEDRAPVLAAYLVEHYDPHRGHLPMIAALMAFHGTAGRTGWHTCTVEDMLTKIEDCAAFIAHEQGDVLQNAFDYFTREVAA